ncbi:hypothetical protein A8C56_04735 [Niabella ginsenosidivorans]|uniref:Alpha/beta hydrolase n=1 Tax=Niabella ginsenosidivorans TaxID=1176587 RepID=A0A1A9HY78_9BACT|nr:alpha/beta hydrolase [Niabella ginsenosidivorans]ANH80378.1 hypothetical protein A8C56_04735 [Niabella ginsenosidivorans]
MLQEVKKRIKLYVGKAIAVLNQSSKGALAGSMAAALICIFYLGSVVHTGLPFLVDLLIILLVSLLIVGFIYACSFYLYRGILKINKFTVTAVIGTCIITAILPDERFNRPFIFLELISGILIGIGFNKKSNWRTKLIFIFLAVLINILVFASLFSKGTDRSVPVSEAYWKQKMWNPVMISDPSQKGIYPVKRLFYGSGTDKWRKEYGKGISLKTDAVDASPYMEPWSHVKTYLRRSYWGFDIKALPLNARVWYPEGTGSFPLVLFVHGNHLMTDYSDPGYEYLGELLASKGFIVASIDENFLNQSWFDDYWFNEMNVRAWLILKHLEYWRKWNGTAGTPFSGKVDLNNICLIGHSRGADAVAMAAVMNTFDHYPYDGNIPFHFNFSIKSIVQIAPPDKQLSNIEIPLRMTNMNYLLLQGSHDQDIYYNAGVRMYNRIKFEPGKNALKTSLYIYRANHGQFNTVWGATDNAFPDQFFMNSGALLKGEDQRKIAKIYISAFLEATLKGRKEYIPLLKDYRNGFNLLPKDYYISQYEDGSFNYIADFEEDRDVSTATLKGCSIEAAGLDQWKEIRLRLRNNEEAGQGNSGVLVGWDNDTSSVKPAPYYAINIPDTALQKVHPDTAGHLFFFIANNSDHANRVNFSIQLKTRSGSVIKPLSDFFIMAPLLKTELAKWNYLPDLRKNMPVERVLQYIQIPFSAFKAADPAFQSSQIEQIKFIFDKEPTGAILIDRIGIN